MSDQALPSTAVPGQAPPRPGQAPPQVRVIMHPRVLTIRYRFRFRDGSVDKTFVKTTVDRDENTREMIIRVRETIRTLIAGARSPGQNCVGNFGSIAVNFADVVSAKVW